MMIRLLYLLLLFSTSPLRADDMRSFTSKPFSFTIGAPLTWKLVPDSSTEEYLIHDKDIHALVTREKSLPLVRIVKPVPDNRTTSPAVQVFVERAEGNTPTEFLSAASRQAAAGFKDFQIIREPSDATLNRMSTAYMESTFVAEFAGDRSFKTLSRMWAIPRDKMMFVIVVSGQPNDLKAVSHDIELILSTVRLKE